MSWFWERFKMAKNVRLVICIGISPVSLFEERSKDSSADNFANDNGIWLVRLLWERLSNRRIVSLPSTSGISPSNLLLDKSIVVKMVRILYSSTLLLSPPPNHGNN